MPKISAISVGFRLLATEHDTKISRQLVEIADELEAKAAAIEQRPDLHSPI
jgi:hypothetical protein